MYNRNVNIIIQSPDNCIEQHLQNFNITSEFNLFFHTAVNPDFNDAEAIDVLIVDVDYTHEHALPTVMPKAIIVYLSRATLDTKSMGDRLHLAHMVWTNATDMIFLRFNLERLIVDIRAKRQQYLLDTYLNTLIDNIPDLIWFKNLDGLHLKVNEAFCQTVGKPREKIVDRDHYDIWDIPKELYEKSDYVCLNTDDIIIQTLQPQAFDEKVFGKNGLRQFLTYKAPLFDERNILVGTMGCAHDVTELRNISTELSMILDNLPFAILVQDNAGLILNANERFRELFNPSNKALTGRKYSYEQYLLPDTYRYTEKTSGSEVVLLQNSQELIFSVQIEPLYDFFQNPLGSLHIYSDITLEKNFHNKMRQLAYTDQLTGLYQRRYLYELENSIKTDKLNLLYIDLDNFKYMNDTYGHVAGDTTLYEFGKLLKKLFPKDVVARIGGDEFVVMISRPISEKILASQAQALLDETNRIFGHNEDVENRLSASIGIACAAPENISLDILLKKADKALYQAKDIGKNCYKIYNN